MFTGEVAVHGDDPEGDALAPAGSVSVLKNYGGRKFAVIL